MRNLGGFLMIIGGIFLFQGTLRAGLSTGYLARLHFLGIADTLGGMLLLLGLMLRNPGEIPLLLVALGALLAWGPPLAYLLAQGGSPEDRARKDRHV